MSDVERLIATVITICWDISSAPELIHSINCSCPITPIPWTQYRQRPEITVCSNTTVEVLLNSFLGYTNHV